MDHLGAEKAHLIGHDWGAAITYMAGTAFPDRFLSLTTMAVPHPGRFGEKIRRNRQQMRRSWYMSFFQLRGVSEFAVSFNNYAFIRKLWRDWSPGWAFGQEDIGPVIETLKRPGVKKAALGYYRSARATSVQAISEPDFKVPEPGAEATFLQRIRPDREKWAIRKRPKPLMVVIENTQWKLAAEHLPIDSVRAHSCRHRPAGKNAVVTRL